MHKDLAITVINKYFVANINAIVVYKTNLIQRRIPAIIYVTVIITYVKHKIFLSTNVCTSVTYSHERHTLIFSVS